MLLVSLEDTGALIGDLLAIFSWQCGWEIQVYGRVCHVCSIGCLPVVIALGVAGLTGDLQVYGHARCVGIWYWLFFLVVIALVDVLHS